MEEKRLQKLYKLGKQRIIKRKKITDEVNEKAKICCISDLDTARVVLYGPKNYYYFWDEQRKWGPL